jgi:hypothetical protein
VTTSALRSVAPTATRIHPDASDNQGAGCYMSGTSGDLVTDPVSGVAIIESNGLRRVVTWPLGWTGSEVEILDSLGDVHTRTGTKVYLMGGYWYKDNSFLTYGGRTN